MAGSNVQGIKDYVIPGKTGLLCNPKSAEEFAEAIHILCYNRVILDNKSIISKYSIENSFQTLAKIYRQVLK